MKSKFFLLVLLSCACMRCVSQTHVAGRRAVVRTQIHTSMESMQLVSSPLIEKYPASLTNPIGYWVQKPADYNASKKYPVNIHLHGTGGRGPGSFATLDQLIVGTPPPYAETPLDLQAACNQYGIMLIAPQIGGDWNVATINSFVDIAFNKFNASKVGISGFSMGGGGVTAYITSQYSNRISWAVSCNGLNWGTNWSNAKNVRTWFFHTLDDQTVRYVYTTEKAVAAMRTAGGNPAVTLDKTGGHSYNKFLQSPDLYSWMLERVVPPPTTVPQLPVALSISGADTVVGSSIKLQVIGATGLVDWFINTLVPGSWSIGYEGGSVYGNPKAFDRLTPGMYEAVASSNNAIVRKRFVVLPAEASALITFPDGSKKMVPCSFVNGQWVLK
jgi:predicted esterase